MNKWLEFDPVTTLQETISIIEDALCYHFEFKVENHKLYFREFD